MIRLIHSRTPTTIQPLATKLGFILIISFAVGIVWAKPLFAQITVNDAITETVTGGMIIRPPPDPEATQTKTQASADWFLLPNT